MDLDVIVGAAANASALAGKYSIAPGSVSAPSALAVVEEVLRRAGPGSIGRLRVFDLLGAGGDTSLPGSQLLRLRGCLAPGARVEIRVADAARSGPARVAPRPAGGFGGSAFQSGQLSGGFGGSAFQSGGFAGAAGPAAKSHQLSAMLGVPVSIQAI